MALDPAVEALIAQVRTKLDALASSAVSIKADLVALVTLLDAPPPPAESVPITFTQPPTATRVDATTVRFKFTLAGTLSRVTQIGGLQAKPTGGGWAARPWTTSTADNSVDMTVQVPAGTAGTYHLHVWDTGRGTIGGWVIAGNIPFPAAEQPPPPTGVDRIEITHDVVGQPIFAVDGQPTVLLGCNGSGQHGYWGGGLRAATHSGSWAGWGWNMLRLFEQDPGGGECQYCPDANNAETTAQVIEEFTSKGIVVMLDYHQFDFGREYTTAIRDKMVAKWTAWANQFKNNPLVMFELANEPEATFHGYKHGATDWNSAFKMMCDRYVAAFGPVIDAIRATGARNMIVIDDAQAGQGCDDFWQIGPSTGSAIMAVGAQLKARDPLHRVAFSVHVYDAFGWGGAGEKDSVCEPRYSDVQRAARLTDYVRRCYAATDSPLIAGEFGWQKDESATTGVGFHAPFTKCGSRTLRAQVALSQAGAKLSLSTTQWNGFQLTLNGNNGFDSANLTTCGQNYMTYCQTMRNGPVVTPALLTHHEDMPLAVVVAAGQPERPEPGSLEEFTMYRPARNTQPEHTLQ